VRLSRFFASSLLSLSLLSSSAIAHPFAMPPSGADPITMPAPSSAKIDRAKLRAALAKRRAASLAAFRAYRLGGVYPHNFDTDGKLNVWLDGEGRLCAAATMIANTGAYDLVMQVAQDNNFIRLADVTDGALMDWILMSGLTQAEVVAIQEPFIGDQGEPRNYRLVRSIPVQPDSDKRIAEDKRLAKRYRQVDAQIVKNRKSSLDRATDLLMQHPDLAAQVLAG
jgi:hypothetical protein